MAVTINPHADNAGLTAFRHRIEKAVLDFAGPDLGPDAEPIAQAFATATSVWLETFISELDRPRMERPGLSEEQADLLSYDRAKDALAAGDDELVPFALLKRTQAGEHPVRVWRDHRGLTQRELARKAGITQSVLSKVETGKSDAQFTTMTRLSKALDIDVDDLVPPAD